MQSGKLKRAEEKLNALQVRYSRVYCTVLIWNLIGSWKSRNVVLAVLIGLEG